MKDELILETSDRRQADGSDRVQQEQQLPRPLTEEQWRAVRDNDSSYDGRFFYAVKTTGIFCRPSCKSRVPNRENIGWFHSSQEALAAQYRPCKRCRPTLERWPDEEWVAAIARYAEQYYRAPLSLEELAQLSHGTPYHLHRTFKRIKGVTPLDYIHSLRINEAKSLLARSPLSIAEVGRAVGMTNTSYFITLFKKKTGHTPNAYRQLHQQEQPHA